MARWNAGMNVPGTIVAVSTTASTALIHATVALLRCRLPADAPCFPLLMMMRTPCLRPMAQETTVVQEVEVNLLKPLGLVLEELEEGGAGVVVVQCVEDGNSRRSAKILPGDRVIKIGDLDVSGETLDEVMGKIGAAKSSVRLTLARDVRVPAGQGNTVLCLPMGGPGAGQSRFDIIRVGESPSTWGLRLLVNSGVIGRMESGHETLVRIAAGRGPSCIVDCGVLEP